MAIKRQSRKNDLADSSALVRGDGATLERLYLSTTPSMIRFARTMTGDHAMAEDLVQETWITVLGKADQFSGSASLRSWIFAILANSARNRLKRENRQTSLDGLLDGSVSGPATDPAAFDDKGRWIEPPSLWDDMTPERIVEGRSAVRFVSEAIEALPSGQRAVILLCAQQGLSDAEAAEVLGTSPGNVRVSLHRARTALRAKLDEAQKKSKGV